jgi:hypothetical protein
MLACSYTHNLLPFLNSGLTIAYFNKVKIDVGL